MIKILSITEDTLEKLNARLEVEQKNYADTYFHVTNVEPVVLQPNTSFSRRVMTAYVEVSEPVTLPNG